jgi:hypothetical protein
MIVAFDTETHLFRPGRMAPEIVCLTASVNGSPAEIFVGLQILELVRGWLDNGASLVGHNVAYDLACLCAADETLIPKVFAAYEADLITDTMLRQKLADIGRGRYRGFANGPVWVPLAYDLGSVGRRHGVAVDKDAPWRMRYAELSGVPLAAWPEDAKAYALRDAEATWAAYRGQDDRYPPELLADQFNQARKAWALHLTSVWGLRTSLRGVLQLEKGAIEELDRLAELLEDSGLLRKDRSRDTKAAKARIVEVCEAQGLEPRLTKTGAICLDSEACKASGDPILEAYADFTSYTKVLSSDVKMLKAGIFEPIHTRFDLATTGRVTSSKPNVQNPRRLAGVRECFVPRGFQE